MPAQPFSPQCCRRRSCGCSPPDVSGASYRNRREDRTRREHYAELIAWRRRRAGYLTPCVGRASASVSTTRKGSRCLTRARSISRFRRAGAAALSAWPKTAGGFTSAAARCADTSAAATARLRSTPASTPARQGTRLSAASSPARTGSGTTTHSSSTKALRWPHQSIIHSTSPHPGRRAACPRIGNASCIRLEPRSCPSSRGALADHIGRGLVVAQPEEARLTQPAVTGPLGKADLGHQLGPCPMRAARDRSRVDEWRLRCLELAQARAKLSERLGAEARTHLPGIGESRPLVVAHEERAEVGPAAARIGVAADDELLLPGALELQPVPRAARRVARVNALGDQALPARSAGVEETPLGIAMPGLAQLQAISRAHRSRQPGTALAERPRAEILALDLENVEGVVHDGKPLHQLARRLDHAQALLQPPEGRLAVLEGHHLTVEQKPRRTQGRHRGAHLGVCPSEALPRARPQGHVVPRLERDAALTVELALQQPLVAELATIGQGRQHQRDRHANIMPLAARSARARRWSTTVQHQVVATSLLSVGRRRQSRAR